jgi:hypothetical protein
MLSNRSMFICHLVNKHGEMLACYCKSCKMDQKQKVLFQARLCKRAWKSYCKSI